MRFAHHTILFLLSAALAALTSCSSDSDGVSGEDCERLRSHLIDLRMESVTADRGQHRTALESALGPRFALACEQRMSMAELRCALAAKDAHELAACRSK